MVIVYKVSAGTPGNARSVPNSMGLSQHRAGLGRPPKFMHMQTAVEQQAYELSLQKERSEHSRPQVTRQCVSKCVATLAEPDY